MLKLSVVTVCYNAEESIEKTIQSVVRQSYENIEYLIIDGKSSDRTLEIVKEYQKEFSWIHLVSEKDTGIYNAMNKSASLAKGDYIYFLNSGDLYWDSCTVEHIMQELEKKNPDILYGNIDIDYRTHKKRICYAKYNRLKKIWIALGATVCHQAVFTKTAWLKSEKFDESFILWADQEWMMRLMKKGVQIERMDIPICVYDGFGQSSSSVNLELVFEESDRITKAYAPIVYVWSKPFKYLLRCYHRMAAK